jgi:2-methylcitrate dehydratase PrpD
MPTFDRRDFFRAMALAGAAAHTAGGARAQSGAPADAQAAIDVTRTLARFVVNARPGDAPSGVRKEAARTLLNWVGCAVGGSRHETVEIALAALAPFSGPAQASVLGRRERLDVLNAALLNGISSHVFDFDDTHLKTIIHPAGPVASAILALAEHRPVAGRDFQHALILGTEVECRIGNAVYPEHYDAGWHITGTAGVFGAAAAAGRLLGLSEQQMVWALGLAATQPVGLKEMFGTMTKSFHPGRAAHNGLTAALLAARGFTSSNQAIEAKAGWANTLSARRDYREITDRLGESWEIALNTYKPFACGVVIHPAIDGCIRLRRQHGLTLEQVDRVELRVHPLVLELTGKKTPATGLEGKFSVYFAAAVAIADGAAGERQFSGAKVRDAAIVAVRDRVSAIVDPSLAEDQAHVAILLKDGRRLEVFVEHAVGSRDNPMTDAALEAKFADLAEGVLPADRVRRLMDLCWRAESLASAAEIAQAARPA